MQVDAVDDIVDDTLPIPARSTKSNVKKKKITDALQQYFASELSLDSSPFGFVGSHLSEHNVNLIVDQYTHIQGVESLRQMCTAMEDHYLTNIFTIVSSIAELAIE
jgi:hypothetical protein